jgi:hypothetical protein
MIYDVTEKFLFQEKTSSALIFIYQKEITYISEVSANIDSTFSHTNKIVKRLEELGLLTSVFEGRSRFLQLTPRGYFLAKSLSDALDTFRSLNEFAFPEGYQPTRQEETEETAIQQNAASDSFNSESLKPSAFDPFPFSLPTSLSSSLSDSGSKAKTNTSGVKTASSILFDRLQFFCLRIKEIYSGLADSAADREHILQKLGPYDRELKLIFREIEHLDVADASRPELMAAYRAAEMQYSFYLGKK